MNEPPATPGHGDSAGRDAIRAATQVEPPVSAEGRPHVLVLRAHSLGDVVLATSVLEPLSRGQSGRVVGIPVIDVATEERYLPVFRGHPAVHRLHILEDLRRSPVAFDHVFDLQGTIGSRDLAAHCGPVTAVRTRPAARRWVVLWGDRFPRPGVPHAVDRYLEVLGLESSAPAVPETPALSSRPVGPGARTPDGDARAPRLERGGFRPAAIVTAEEDEAARVLAPAAFASEAGAAVALLTGASRKSKEYPVEQFARLARLLEARGIPVWWIAPPEAAGGARPDAGQAQSPAAVRSSPPFRLPLGPLKAVLARAALAVSSDSGPMHLASALGLPVLALFGSSVRAFGFAPAGPEDRVLEVDDLPCRPCGVHGRNHCWLGHWRCLRELSPERVERAVLDMLETRIPGADPARVLANPRRKP